MDDNTLKAIQLICNAMEDTSTQEGELIIATALAKLVDRIDPTFPNNAVETPSYEDCSELQREARAT